MTSEEVTEPTQEKEATSLPADSSEEVPSENQNRDAQMSVESNNEQTNEEDKEGDEENQEKTGEENQSGHEESVDEEKKDVQMNVESNREQTNEEVERSELVENAVEEEKTADEESAENPQEDQEMAVENSEEREENKEENNEESIDDNKEENDHEKTDEETEPNKESTQESPESAQERQEKEETSTDNLLKESRLSPPHPNTLRANIRLLNDYLICPICKGYFRDAYTIPECLHTCTKKETNTMNSILQNFCILHLSHTYISRFLVCKVCIYRFFIDRNTIINHHCPVCGVLLEKNPLESLK